MFFRRFILMIATCSLCVAYGFDAGETPTYKSRLRNFLRESCLTVGAGAGIVKHVTRGTALWLWSTRWVLLGTSAWKLAIRKFAQPKKGTVTDSIWKGVWSMGIAWFEAMSDGFYVERAGDDGKVLRCFASDDLETYEWMLEKGGKEGFHRGVFFRSYGRKIGGSFLSMLLLRTLAKKITGSSDGPTGLVGEIGMSCAQVLLADVVDKVCAKPSSSFIFNMYYGGFQSACSKLLRTIKSAIIPPAQDSFDGKKLRPMCRGC